MVSQIVVRQINLYIIYDHNYINSYYLKFKHHLIFMIIGEKNFPKLIHLGWKWLHTQKSKIVPHYMQHLLHSPYNSLARSLGYRYLPGNIQWKVTTLTSKAHNIHGKDIEQLSFSSTGSFKSDRKRQTNMSYSIAVTFRFIFELWLNG